jgi:hypothetical protein
MWTAPVAGASAEFLTLASVETPDAASGGRSPFRLSRRRANGRLDRVSVANGKAGAAKRTIPLTSSP